MNCELVVAGNLSLDDVSLPDGSRQKNVIGGEMCIRDRQYGVQK